MGPGKRRDVQKEFRSIESGHLKGERIGAGGKLLGGRDGEANEV